MTTTDPAGAPPTGAPGSAPNGRPNRFFDWLRTLGMPRRSGWLGGVCAGLAWRIGVDPIIVRGIAVVLAVFGLPLIFLYAVAWALLPDSTGRIHLEELVRGRFDPAMVGVVVLLVASFLPIVQGAWGVFGSVAAEGPWTQGSWLGRFFPFSWFGFGSVPLFGALLVAALIALLVWVVVRATRGPGEAPDRPDAAPAPSMPSTADIPVGVVAASQAAAARHPDAVDESRGSTWGESTPIGPDAGTSDAAAAAFATSDQPTAGAPATSDRPGASGAPTGDEEFAAWREQHEAWKRDRDEWKRAQSDADRAARASWVAENKARAEQFHAQAAEDRRARRRARPRTSVAFVLTTLGAAIVAAAGVAIWALGEPDASDYAATVAVLAAAVVVGLAMVVAGAIRRRSGFLAFVAIALLAVGVGTAVIPREGAFLIPGASLQAWSLDARYVQPLGDLDLWIDEGNLPADGFRTEIDKTAGSVRIGVAGDVAVRVVAELGDGDVETTTFDPDGAATTTGVERSGTTAEGADVFRTVIGQAGAPVVGEIRIRIDQGSVFGRVFEQ